MNSSGLPAPQASDDSIADGSQEHGFLEGIPCSRQIELSDPAYRSLAVPCRIWVEADNYDQASSAIRAQGHRHCSLSSEQA